MDKDAARNLVRNTVPRVIGYAPVYRELTGSITGALLLAQLIYWSAEKERFWKTDAELQEETGLTEKELRSAKKTIKQLPFIIVTVEGTPPTTWYEMDFGAWVEIMSQNHTGVAGLNCTKLNCPKGEIKTAQRAGLKLPKGREHKVTEITAKITKKKTPSGTPEGCVGFGLTVPDDTNTTEFDHEMTTILEKAIRTLPARHTGITQTRPSTWASHIHAIHTKDNYTEEEIRRAMAWYTAHIGEEFVPRAYSGASFRKKFPAILDRAEAGLDGIEIGPVAVGIIEHLEIRAWPPACQKELPAAVQVSVTAYHDWVAARNTYTARLATSAVPADKRLLSFGQHLRDVMPPSNYFVRAWFEEIRKHVAGWAGWSGNLQPLLFHPGAKDFQRMGRAWAQAYCAKPEVWDMFCAAMGNE